MASQTEHQIGSHLATSGVCILYLKTAFTLEGTRDLFSACSAVICDAVTHCMTLWRYGGGGGDFPLIKKTKWTNIRVKIKTERTEKMMRPLFCSYCPCMSLAISLSCPSFVLLSLFLHMTERKMVGWGKMFCRASDFFPSLFIWDSIFVEDESTFSSLVMSNLGSIYHVYCAGTKQGVNRDFTHYLSPPIT